MTTVVNIRSSECDILICRPSKWGNPFPIEGRMAREKAIAMYEVWLRRRPDLIARVLAQETPLILADEPVAGLDPAAQIATMAVFAGLAGEGRGVLASIHDLGLAARHCTRLVALSHGRLVADGPPGRVLTPALLAEVFGIRAHFAETPEGPVFQPLAVLGDGPG